MYLELLRQHIRRGELTLVDHDGTSHRFGEGEPRVTWLIRSPDAMPRILRNPALNLGDTYMEQLWDVVDGKLAELLLILRRNVEAEVLTSSRLRMWGAMLHSWNHVRASLANVSWHYDLDETLFRAFLDRNMHYSCAYFRDPDMSLESAQVAKCNHIAGKLLLEPGQRVLDIGSGWGSFAMYLAEHFDVRVTGLTLSAEQLRASQAEAARRGLLDRVEFRLEDYRQHDGTYDRIASIGMFEHVGRRYFRRFFRRVREMLRPGGVALLHSIGSPRPPGATNPWIRRHVFPGGYIPSLSEVAAAVERAKLLICDVEVLRRHYAFTLKEWNRRFQSRRAELAASKGERFCRMWEFYLVISRTAFELDLLDVLQVQLAHGEPPVPITRDYLYAQGAGATAHLEALPAALRPGKRSTF